MLPKHDLSKVESEVLESFFNWLDNKAREVDIEKEIVSIDGLVIFKDNETVEENISRLFGIWLNEECTNNETS